MSDYMTEVEQIKKEITELHFGPCDINPEGMSVEKFNFYAYARQRFASLITTIESQKEEIESLTDRNRQLQGMFNSQDKTARMYYEELQSLKAITELAVKGLKEQLQIAHVWGSVTNQISIENTLSEIGRIQNE